MPPRGRRCGIGTRRRGQEGADPGVPRRAIGRGRRERGVYEALQRQWPHLLGRLVFISGYADALDERLRTFITQNGVPIISKPFKRSQISEAIKGKEL